MTNRSRTKSFLSAVVLGGGVMLAGVIGTMGCGGTSYTVSGTGPAADADAKIEVEKSELGNRMVIVTIEHLPRPERIASGSTAYVVWFIAKGRPAQAAGRLQFDEDTRSGKGGGTVAFDDEFTVLVTAEETDHATAPSKNVVVRQEID